MSGKKENSNSCCEWPMRVGDICIQGLLTPGIHDRWRNPAGGMGDVFKPLRIELEPLRRLRQTGVRDGTDCV